MNNKLFKLARDKVAASKTDFTFIETVKYVEMRDGKACPTLGCVAGDLVNLFPERISLEIITAPIYPEKFVNGLPDEMQETTNFYPVLDGIKHEDWEEFLRVFFQAETDLDRNVIATIFFDTGTKFSYGKSMKLITREDVIAMMDKYLEMVKDGKEN